MTTLSKVVPAILHLGVGEDTKTYTVGAVAVPGEVNLYYTKYGWVEYQGLKTEEGVMFLKPVEGETLSNIFLSEKANIFIDRLQQFIAIGKELPCWVGVNEKACAWLTTNPIYWDLDKIPSRKEGFLERALLKAFVSIKKREVKNAEQ